MTGLFLFLANLTIIVRMKNIKLLNIVGARPQIIKASAISRIIRDEYSGIVEERILHTGQHYDRRMSDVFFEELKIPRPHFNLGVGSARHGRQTAAMISGVEEVLIKEKPDVVVIYGDTNSTLAAAIATSKLKIPVVHIEAGLRSFNKGMPEEINRILSDHVSTLLFAPTDTAFKNLIKEGFRPDNSPPYSVDNPKIFLSGDIMYDNSLFFAELAGRKLLNYLDDMGLEEDNYILCTIHRDLNADYPDRLEAILGAIMEIARSSKQKAVLPLHPRTVHALERESPALLKEIRATPGIIILEPVSFLEMIMLEKSASIIMTDSGGVQKESHFFCKPSIVLRAETEWTELVRNGTAILADADRQEIISAWEYLSGSDDLVYPGFYGDGHAARFIMNEITLMAGDPGRTQGA